MRFSFVEFDINKNEKCMADDLKTPVIEDFQAPSGRINGSPGDAAAGSGPCSPVSPASSVQARSPLLSEDDVTPTVEQLPYINLQVEYVRSIALASCK